MTTPRIAPTPLPLSDALQERMNRILRKGMAVPNLYLAVARNEAMFIEMVDMQLIGPTGLFDRGRLSKPLREMIILRTCVAARNDYEYNLHIQTISERMGLSKAQIEDIRAPAVSSTLWSDGERALIDLIDGLVKRIEVSDAVYGRAREYFDEPALIEITQIVGLYTGVAMMVALTRPQHDQYQSR